jgi:hypothetical protein
MPQKLRRPFDFYLFATFIYSFRLIYHKGPQESDTTKGDNGRKYTRVVDIFIPVKGAKESLLPSLLKITSFFISLPIHCDKYYQLNIFIL